MLYKAIAKHPNPREIYAKKLSEQGTIEANLAKEMEREFKKMLQEDLEDVRADKKPKNNNLPKNTWSVIKSGTKTDFERSFKTSISKSSLEKVANAITSFQVIMPQLKK